MATKNKQYDVLLSFNREDREAVEKIAIYLADSAGLRPWFDQWELIPGEDWIDTLERGLHMSQSCAVFVGKSGEGPWQQREVEGALRQQLNNLEFRVIPVLLPGASHQPELPSFLAGNMWVDFRDGLNNDDMLWRLECGIRGVAPGRGRPAQCQKEQTGQERFTLPVPIQKVALQYFHPGGALGPDSDIYIMRRQDEELFEAISRPRAFVTIKGARQTGKTSLVIKAYGKLRKTEQPLQVAFVDFQVLPSEAVQSIDKLWKAITINIARQLHIEEWDETSWNEDIEHDENLEIFLEQCIFHDNKKPLLLCFDEVDRLFQQSASSNFWASVRSFYNVGALDPVWGNVRWVLTTSTEPRFFIEDPRQSPFNIGLQIELSPFSSQELSELAARYGLRLKNAELEKIMTYLGGHPYLVQLLFYYLVRSPEISENFFDASTAGNGIFREHLSRFLVQFQQEQDLAQTMQDVITGRALDNLKIANRLEAAGLVRRNEYGKIVPFCELYAEFFAKALGVIRDHLRLIQFALENESFRDYRQLAQAIIERMTVTAANALNSPGFEQGTVWDIALPALGLHLETGRALLFLRHKEESRECYKKLEQLALARQVDFLMILDIMDIRKSTGFHGVMKTLRFRPKELMTMVTIAEQELPAWLGRFIITQLDANPILPLLPYNESGRSTLFIGREDELQRLLAGRQRGGIILGANQSGKTSLLWQLSEILQQQQRQIAGEGPMTFSGEAPTFLIKTLAALKVQPSPNITIAEWGAKLREYASDGQCPVFLIDEAQNLVKADAKTDGQLGWEMRSLQNDGICEFFLAGHSELRKAVRIAEGPFRNFAEEITLTGLTETAGMRLIQEPITDIGFNISDDQAQRIFRGTAGVPVLIQKFCIQLLQKRRDFSKRNIENSEIEAVERSGYLGAVLDYYMYGQLWDSTAVMLMAAIHENVTRGDLMQGFKQHGVALSRNRLDEILKFLTQFGVLQEYDAGHYRIWAGYLTQAIMTRDPHELLAEEIKKGQEGAARHV
jgi:hypothetical protein